MEGVRVVEVAAWTFVPAAGAVLAEWGADVLKIEHPVTGDPQRGLISSGLVPAGASNVNVFVEQPNHGKRSVGIDLGHPEGRQLLYRLVETADVFLTNWLPDARRKQQIDLEHIRAVKPDIIYVRGSGQGVRGPDAGKGGYDGSSYFARSGVAMALAGSSGTSDPYGPQQPPAFGDIPGGMTIAGAIAAAYVHKLRTGEGSVVDVSLLGFGLFQTSPGVVMAKIFEGQAFPRFGRGESPNPLVNRYLTSDGRLVQLMMLQGLRFWPELITAVGHPELAADERFTNPAGFFEHRGEAIRVLDETFAAHPLEHWRRELADIEGVWCVVQQPLDLYDDPQVIANGYLADIEAEDGSTFQLPRNPVQFDEEPPTLTRAPNHGEHTDEVLRELGLDDDELIRLKIENAIL
jgi:crotonobetainyl-CoA:carnitine CoA-transferase CaiB-like acyl-CoA transferase